MSYTDSHGNKLTTHRVWDTGVLVCANSPKEQHLPTSVTTPIRDAVKALIKENKNEWNWGVHKETDIGENVSPLQIRCESSKSEQEKPVRQ